MNREYKFRGKRVDNGEWVYGSFTECCPNDCYVGKIGAVAGADVKFLGNLCWTNTIGQYTGLKDKNVIEIYENDFIKYGNRVLLIKYNTDIASYVAYGKDKEGNFTNLWLAPTVSLGNMLSSEVIGNTIDNPELLEVK